MYSSNSTLNTLSVSCLNLRTVALSMASTLMPAGVGKGGGSPLISQDPVRNRFQSLGEPSGKSCAALTTGCPRRGPVAHFTVALAGGATGSADGAEDVA